MRDLVFKNLTSSDRRKKVISSCETVQRQGVRTTIRRHFICKVIEITGGIKKRPLPQVYVRRTCNHVYQKESYFCRMKASLFAKSNGRLFLILFGHSIKIDTRSIIAVLS